MIASRTLADFIKSHARPGLTSQEQKAGKQAAAAAALELVEPGMSLGLGTGSTVRFFLEGLAGKIRAGLKVEGVPTSVGTEMMARELGIPLRGDTGDFPRLDNDLCVDGADRVDNEGHLIKGGGGALLREKMVAARSKRVCIMVDATKLEPVFSDSFPLPVEILPFGRENTVEELATAGCQPALRRTEEGLLVTDNGNNIVDCTFETIPDPAALELRLKSLVGVVEVGIFTNLLDTLVLGGAEGATLWHR